MGGRNPRPKTPAAWTSNCDVSRSVCRRAASPDGLVVVGGDLRPRCDATARSGGLFAAGAPVARHPADGGDGAAVAGDLLSVLDSPLVLVEVPGHPAMSCGVWGESRTGLAAPVCLLFSDDALPRPPLLAVVVGGVPLDLVEGRGGTRAALVAQSGLGCGGVDRRGRAGAPQAVHTGTVTGGLSLLVVLLVVPPVPPVVGGVMVAVVAVVLLVVVLVAAVLLLVLALAAATAVPRAPAVSGDTRASGGGGAAVTAA